MIRHPRTGLLVFLCASVAGTPTFGQTFSDIFQTRQLLTGASASVSGSNSNATREAFEPLHAGKIGGHSVWISWLAPDNGLLTLGTSGSSFDTLLALYTLRPGTNSPMQRLREVGGDDDDDDDRSLSSHLAVGVTSNQTYEIAVDGFNGASGDISLQLSFISSTNLQPTVLHRPGDQSLRIGDPLILSVGIVKVRDMNLRWYLNGMPITGDGASPTLVIPSLQRTNLGFYTVRLELEDDSFYSSPVEVQINSEGQPDVLARYKAPDAARSGLFRKAGSTGVTLGYNGTQIFNTTNSVLDTNAPSICGVTGGAPYWFSYQAPTNGIMAVDTSGSSYPTLLGVFTYDGTLYSYTNLFSVTCDTTSGPNGQPSSVHFAANAGRNYFIVVDGVNGARGIAHLNYSLTNGLPPLPPAITVQPQSLTVSRQTTVALNVMADGTAPLTYQWWRDTTLLDQQTNASLLLMNPSSKDAGAYIVVISNAVGNITSDPANVQIITGARTSVNIASNWMVSAFPGTRGYQYTADCSTGGTLDAWWPWATVFPDYGGVIWLTNTIQSDGSLFLRVHSP